MRKLLRVTLEMSTVDLVATLAEWCDVKEDKYRIKKPYKDYDLKGSNDRRVWVFAHTDKKRTNNRIEVLYDPKMQTAWSFEGLGADDRAGVYALIQLYIEMHRKDRPVLVFCDEEESGAQGARQFTPAWKEAMSTNCLAMLEFDRRGSEDAVYYNEETKVFKKKVKEHGFIETGGSFSDISIVGRETLICGTNLSVGYYDQHTAYERLEIDQLYQTIKKGKGLIKDIQDENKQYKMKKWQYKKPVNNYRSSYSSYGQRQYHDDDFDYMGFDARSHDRQWRNNSFYQEATSNLPKEDLVKKWNMQPNDMYAMNTQCHLCRSSLFGAKYDLTVICGRCVKTNADADPIVNAAMEKKGRVMNGTFEKKEEIEPFTRKQYWCTHCLMDFPDITEEGIYFGRNCPNCLQPGTEEGYSQGAIRGI